MDNGLEGYTARGIQTSQGTRDKRKEGFRKGWIQDRRDKVQEKYRTAGGKQDRWDKGQEGYRTGGKQDRWD